MYFKVIDHASILRVFASTLKYASSYNENQNSSFSTSELFFIFTPDGLTSI